jgi:ParB family chromosome partitioning protein
MEKSTDPVTTPPGTSKIEAKKTGLGRGLAALLGGDDELPFVSTHTAPVAPPIETKIQEYTLEAAPVVAPVEDVKEEEEANSYKILRLNVDKILPNAEQPRQHFEDAKLQELAESICEQGLIQPIVVRLTPDQNYQIVAGERRWRACKMLGMTEIPAILREEDAQPDKADLASVIENIQRVELNPVELADAYAKIIKNYNFTQETLAKKLGVSRAAVANTVRLQKLPESVKLLVVSGTLSEGHARALLALEEPSKIEKLAKEAVAESLNVRDVEARVRLELGVTSKADAKKAETAQEVPSKANLEANFSKNPEIQAIEEELRGIFGTKVNLKGNARGGVLELYYSNEDSLHRLLHQIRSIKS